MLMRKFANVMIKEWVNRIVTVEECDATKMIVVMKFGTRGIILN